ncbi:unnamed protein product [Rhodiola kirilowii]
MAKLGKLGIQVELKTPAREAFDFFMKNLGNLPQMLPETVQSLEMLQGDLSTADSVMLLKYNLGAPMAAKIKINDLDKNQKMVTYEFIEGDVLKLYKSFTTKLQFADGYVTWEAGYEKVSESAQNPDLCASFAATLLTGMDKFLSKH